MILAKVFGLSRQAFYQREKRLAEKLKIREIVKELIKPIRKKMSRLGTVKLHDKLVIAFQENNIKMGRDKLNTMLGEEDMLVPRKKNYTRTTDSNHHFHKWKNLIKGLDVKRPEEVFVSDITYIDTDQGHEYLSIITDYYSKQLMGYHLSQDLKAEGPLKALEMAIKNRKYPDRKLIHHSDRGLQYCCNKYIAMLTKNNITPSMTEKYDPYENAVAERINGILKDEFGIGDGFVNHAQACKEIRIAIETYNTERPHYSCEMMTPAQAHIEGTFKRKLWGGKKKHNKNKSATQEQVCYSDNFLSPQKLKKNYRK